MPNNIEIHDSLHHYLTQTSPGYAVMVNGGWGSGKSYYVKNVLQQCIDKKWVYVSLFGLTRAEQIDDAIGSAILTLPDSGFLKEGGEFLAKFFGDGNAAGLAGTLASATGKWTRSAVLKGISENHVLILDDLERFNSGKDISDALAIASRYAEIQGASVIVVGDLTKLTTVQLAYEEKAIRYTYNFKQSYEDVWKISISAFKKQVKFYKFLQTLSREMEQNLKTINCTNIRTVMIGLGAVELLFSRYEKSFSDYASQAAQLVLEAVYYAKVRAEKRIDFVKFEKFIEAPVSFWMQVHLEEKTKEKDSEGAWLKKIADDFPGSEAQYPSLWWLLQNGTIDAERFESEIQRWLPIAEIPELDLLLNIYSHNDASACDQAINKIIDQIKQKNLIFGKMEKLFKLCLILDRLSTSDSLPCNETDLKEEILSFIDVVSNNPENWFEKISILETSKFSAFTHHPEKTPNYELYAKSLEQLWSKVREWRLSFDAERANSWLQENPPNWEELDQAYGSLPILYYVDCSLLKHACDSRINHEAIRQAHIFFMHRAQSSFNNQERELPAVLQLRKELSETWALSAPSVLNESRKWLLESLDVYIARLNELKEKETLKAD